jgi:adenylosuccinate synthase
VNEKRATVIIGAGYGDEGKGLLTDFFAARSDAALVVRFNGGCQAGHTVVTTSGKRHVFSHFGSGTFAGAKTYLSKFFIVNPMWFFKERAMLEALDVAPETLEVMVDPRALVTTPYDMMINQIVETARGGSRHGSCGTGINETIERSAKSDSTITVGDLMREGREGNRVSGIEQLRRTLDSIKNEWMPERLRALGVGLEDAAMTPFSSLLQGDDIAERWLEDAFEFAGSIVAGEAHQLAAHAAHGTLIFEGAQGLMLDMDRGVFPYMTRSNTGIKNVLSIGEEVGLDHLDIVYAHRAYATRHGAGPFARETGKKPFPGINEVTNITNTYQGSFRYGYLDLDVLRGAITDDLSDVSGVSTSVTLALSCLDQVDDGITYFADGEKRTASRESLPVLAGKSIASDRMMTSVGPRRDDIAVGK